MSNCVCNIILKTFPRKSIFTIFSQTETLRSKVFHVGDKDESYFTVLTLHSTSSGGKEEVNKDMKEMILRSM
jgi:hypothetical protein